MTRTFAFIAAVALAAPATAANYAGTPAAAAAATKIVARDIVWNLAANGTYQGRTDESRPLVLCQSLAKKAGALTSFAVNGQAIADTDLAKCNQVAPQSSRPALAQAK